MAVATSVATWYVHDTGNDFWWRAKAPAEAVGGRVAVIKGADIMQALSEPNVHTPLPWSIRLTLEDGSQVKVRTSQGWTYRTNARTRYTHLEPEYPSHEGAAIFTRPAVLQAMHGEQMRSLGIRTIAETDDNYLANQNFNLLLREIDFGPKEREMHARVYHSFDAIVFSTEWLRDRYFRELRDKFGRKGMPELCVARNHVDLKHWPEPVERDPGAPVRVGFMGSTSHLWDINRAYGAFKAAKQAGATTTVIGYNPANPDKGYHLLNRSERSQAFIEAWSDAIDTHIPWVESDQYHRAALPLDIGLCPLIHNDFTAGKSDVKAIEYTISGAAVVAMNLPIYNSNWKHEETCLLVNDWREMVQAVLRLIYDPKLRYELVTNAQEYVREERGHTQLNDEWKAAIYG